MIATIRSGTLLNTPRRMRLRVSSPKNLSTRFNQELEVGVKCVGWKYPENSSENLIMSGKN